jgi:hypothetical protein
VNDLFVDDAGVAIVPRSTDQYVNDLAYGNGNYTLFVTYVIAAATQFNADSVNLIT